jgi:hypothetical protein
MGCALRSGDINNRETGVNRNLKKKWIFPVFVEQKYLKIVY